MWYLRGEGIWMSLITNLFHWLKMNIVLDLFQIGDEWRWISFLIYFKSEVNPVPDHLLDSMRGGKSNGLYVPRSSHWWTWRAGWRTDEMHLLGHERIRLLNGCFIPSPFSCSSQYRLAMWESLWNLHSTGYSWVRGRAGDEEFKVENHDQGFHGVLAKTRPVWRRDLPMQCACYQMELINFHWKRKGCWSRCSGEIICTFALTGLSLRWSSQSHMADRIMEFLLCTKIAWLRQGAFSQIG